MKAEMWFIGRTNNGAVQERWIQTPEAGIMRMMVITSILSEPPDSSTKNGYHLVLTETDPPNKGGLSLEYLGSPSTDLKGDNSLFYRDIHHLEKAVGQLLISGSVTSSQCRGLLENLAWLGSVFGKFRQELLGIPIDKLRLADAAVAEQK